MISVSPFYGAQCPSYPACEGGCGLGCTREIEVAAQYLVQTVERNLWDGIRSDGRAKDDGFEPFHSSQHSFSVNGNARQEDYRDVIREIARLLSSGAAQGSSEAREKEITRLATIEECARLADCWLAVHGDNEIKYTSAREYASDAVADVADAIRGLAHPSTEGK